MEDQAKHVQRNHILVHHLQFIAFNHIIDRINQYVQNQNCHESSHLLNRILLCINDIQINNHQKSEIVIALVQPNTIYNENGQLEIANNLAHDPKFKLENAEQILRLCVQNQKSTLLEWSLNQIAQPQISLLNELLIQTVLHNNAVLFKILTDHGAQWSIEHQTGASPVPLTCIELAILLDKPSIANHYFKSGYLFPMLDRIVEIMFRGIQPNPLTISRLNRKSCLLITLERLIINQTQFIDTLENYTRHERLLSENPREIMNPLRVSYQEQLIHKIKATGCYFHTNETLEDIIKNKSCEKILEEKRRHETELAHVFLEASQQSKFFNKP